MRKKQIGIMALTTLVVAGTVSALQLSQASDHADTREVVNRAGTDLTDVYMFQSPEKSDRYILAMNVNPLIARGASGGVSFDPDALYQFKIDQTADGIEDRVVQVWFEGTGPTQVVRVSPPTKPNELGATNTKVPSYSISGVINTTFFPEPNVRIFAGAREDSFFFDLEQFFNILPDRGVPPGLTSPPVNPNQPMQTSWRSPATAVDFLSNGGFNVLSIVIELPQADRLT